MLKTEDAKPVKPTPQQLRKLGRERFIRARRAGSAFQRQLSKLGNHIGALVKKHAPGGVVSDWRALRKALNDYAAQIRPWAESITESLHTEVAQRDAQAWFQAGREIGQHLREEIASAPTGKMMKSLLAEQVDLITSLPTEAAERVHKLTLQRIAQGRRPESLAQEILKTGEVTVARARMIARTETARTAAALTEVRAKHIGSEGYLWRTANDSDVRPAIGTPGFSQLNTLAMGSHRKLEGTFHRWDEPPIAAPTGEHAHPGSIWNCRCFSSDTLVTKVTGIEKLYRSYYRGDLCRVTIGDAEFTATPNHPMLTQRGWVHVCELQDSDYLVQVLRDPHIFVEANVDSFHATFGELFGSLPGRVDVAPGILFDLYGRVPDGDVHTKIINQLLTCDNVAKSLKRSGNFTLAKPNSGVEGAICGGGAHVAETSRACSSDALLSPFQSHSPHADFVGTADASSSDAGLIESLSDGPTIDVVERSEFEFANSRKVLGDDLFSGEVFAPVAMTDRRRPMFDDATSSTNRFAEIVRANFEQGRNVFKTGAGIYALLPFRNDFIRKFPFSGHVYTLQTDVGWYGVSAMSIIAQNCWAEPVLPDRI